MEVPWLELGEGGLKLKGQSSQSNLYQHFAASGFSLFAYTSHKDLEDFRLNFFLSHYFSV